MALLYFHFGHHCIDAVMAGNDSLLRTVEPEVCSL